MSVDEEGGADDLDLAADTFSKEPPTLTALVARRLPDGSKEEFEVSYAVVAGLAIHQGDISLGDAATVARREAARRGPELALIITRPGERWPGGVLPYVSDDGSAAVVSRAMRHIADRTSVRPRPRTAADQNWVRFETGGADHSEVGMQGGEQIISLSAGCSTGTAVHEICHALGLWHEQCRQDRDAHITVVTDNVLAGCLPQFDIRQSNSAPVGPYDYGSIMHYGPHDFAREDGLVTIRTKDGRSIGQRNGLSPGDIAGLRALYL